MPKLRTMLAFWRVAYGGSTWRRFGYAVIGVPLGLTCLPLALAGRGRAAARYQLRAACRLGGLPTGRPRPGRLGSRLVAASITSVAAGLAALAVLQLLAYFLLVNLAYPIRDFLSVPDTHGHLPGLPWASLSWHRSSHAGGVWASTYHAWGGPTLAGTWAVHAGLALLSGFPVLAWAVRGLTRLQARLARALLGTWGRASATRPSPWDASDANAGYE